MISPRCLLAGLALSCGCSVILATDEAAAPDADVDADSDVDVGPVEPCDFTGTRCVEGVEETCEDDRLVDRWRCPFGCLGTAGIRCARVVPSNVDVALLDAPAADVEVVVDTDLDTSSCAWELSTPSVAPQGDGTEVCVVTAARFSVAAGATLSVRGSRPLVILASDDVVIRGVLDASASGVRPGPGGGRGGIVVVGDTARAGDGPSGGGAGMHSAAGVDGIPGTRDDNTDGGGGGGGMCGAGGSGGSPASLSLDGGGGDALAISRPSWELSPLLGGSGGGAGHGDLDPISAGEGGAGGGGLQITSQRSITVSGRVLAGGGAGQGGCSRVIDPRTGEALPVTPYCAGGGGGSGGAILLEAPSVEVALGGAVVATGGGGGSGGGGTDGYPAGHPGEDGAAAGLERASGGASPGRDGEAGGLSGGGPVLDGVAGGGGDAYSEGGGGGGAAGCIVIRTPDAAQIYDRLAFSPSTGLGLRVLRLDHE